MDTMETMNVLVVKNVMLLVSLVMQLHLLDVLNVNQDTMLNPKINNTVKLLVQMDIIQITQKKHVLLVIIHALLVLEIQV